MERYNRPQNPFVAGFIGAPKMNLIQGRVAQARNAEYLGIRPEHIDTSPHHGEWRGRMRDVEHLGWDTVAYVDGDEVGNVTVRMNGEVPIGTGDKIFMRPQAGNMHVFQANGHVERV